MGPYLGILEQNKMFKYVIQLDVRTLTAKDHDVMVELVRGYILGELGAKEVTGTVISASRMG